MENGEDVDSLSWVHLNVGGKKFCSSIGTLTQREPDSMLAAMFSGRHTLKNEKGHVLIDKDGEYFGYILNWLRDGDLPYIEARQYAQLLKEAKYFQLLDLIENINVTDLTRSDVIKCIQSKNGTFRGLNLSGLDLSNIHFSDTNFNFACLCNVLFAGAYLSGCNFYKANLEGANFTGALLYTANLNGEILSRANFNRSNLEKANLSRATIVCANFADANLTYAKLCDIVNAVDSIFSSATFERCDFTRTNLEGATFTGARLEAANLNEANLSRANFTSANLEKADLSRVTLSRTNFTDAN